MINNYVENYKHIKSNIVWNLIVKCNIKTRTSNDLSLTKRVNRATVFIGDCTPKRISGN